MKTLKIFGITLFATMLLCTSCDLITEKIGFKANKEKEKSETIETQKSYDYPTPESKKTVIKRFTVTAEIYRVIQEGTSFYEKATNHYSDIEITLYSDGTAYCTSISSNLPMPVRCLASGSYDFECNNGQIVYKFNTDEMF